MSPSGKRLSELLPGTSFLESRIDITSTGERYPDPLLGEDPIALLVYDRSGHFAAQFMKRDRGAHITVPSTRDAINNTLAQDGYDAYFGTYCVDDTENAVTQQIIGALSSSNVGMILTRAMTIRQTRNPHTHLAAPSGGGEEMKESAPGLIYGGSHGDDENAMERPWNHESQ